MSYIDFVGNTLHRIIQGLMSLRISIDGFSFSLFAMIFVLALLGLIVEMIEGA